MLISKLQQDTSSIKKIFPLKNCWVCVRTVEKESQNSQVRKVSQLDQSATVCSHHNKYTIRIENGRAVNADEVVGWQAAKD